jgi:hypothetical protein
MSTTNFIIINSAFRTADSKSTTDFTYSIGESLEVDGITIKDISIPNVAYNITSNNNKLRVTYGGVTGNLVIPEGQYTLAQLMTVLQTDLTTLFGVSVTVSQEPITKKVVFVTTQPFRISNNPTTSSLSKYIGIAYGTGYYPTLETSGFTLPLLPQLQGPNNYLVASQVLSQGYASILTDGQRVPVIMPVPVTVDWGEVQQYESNDMELNTKSFARLQNIQNIDIKIYDDNLNVVDLNGQDVEIVLKVKVKDNLPSHLNRLGLGK